MAFAYFIGHMFKGDAPVFLPLLNGGTAAILFCFACLYLATAGGGPFSVDAMMRKKQLTSLQRHCEHASAMRHDLAMQSNRQIACRFGADALAMTGCSHRPSIPAAPRLRISNCAAPARS